MEIASSTRRRGLKERALSPERTKVWVEPNPKPLERKVQVVYYLTRNGSLEHPHFMEISIPSGEGLYLRDVTARLNLLRGEGMTSLYAWSSKRSYRNGFVWQDLTEGDFIYPSHGNEYVLKGSEILRLNSSRDKPVEHPKSIKDDSDVTYRKDRTAWSSFDFNEYKNKMRAGNPAIKEEEEEEENTATELERNEISPPHSSSSSETLEAKDGNASNSSRRKINTRATLMQLMSMVSHFKGRMPRAVTSEGVKGGNSFSAVELEDEEYFSGSLNEKKGSESSREVSIFRRSSSCNVESGLKMELEEEVDGVRARCIPRKLKAKASKNRGDATESKS